MVQFYFLLVLLNILAGIILISTDSSTELDLSDLDADDKKQKSVKGALENDSIFTNETFGLVTGALCALISFITLFFSYSKTGKSIPIIGDLLPSILGLAGGATILLDYYSKSFADHDLPDFVETVFFNNKKYIGFACIIAAIIHFIIPGFIVF
ncbi:MAG: hypothetical protein KBS84_00880 [Treponema sp.]|nr:hypothetical protein [Candidatus Treponema scatequi]